MRDCSNLVLTIPEAHADPFLKWHDDFVVKGNYGKDWEKNGTLEYLTSDMKQTQIKVSLNRMGIFRITPVRTAAGSTALRRVKVEMYLQEVAVDFIDAKG